MKIIDSEQLICVDCDETLLLWDTPVTPDNEKNVVTFFDPYAGYQVSVLTHPAHIKIVKDRKARGATIILWSQSGYQWAMQTAKACGLLEHVDYCASKPIAIIDDKPAADWLQEQIYLKPTSKYGKSAYQDADKISIDSITTFNIG